MTKAKRRQIRRSLTALGLLVPAAAVGVALCWPPKIAPQPKIDAQTTSAVPVEIAGLTDGGRIIGNSLTALKDGLDALSSGDVERARATRDALPADVLDRHILAWAIALKGGRQVPSADIQTAAKALPGWPGMDGLRRNLERALSYENPEPRVVIAALGNAPAETAEGAIMLARAHVAQGDMEGARALLSPFWRTQRLDIAAEARIIGEFGSLIAQADHRFRMERMLYANRTASARRVAALAGATALCEAWAAAAKGDKAAKKLLDAVPKDQHGAGFIFAQARYLRATRQYAAAAAMMATATKDAAALVDPDAWWVERRVLSRELVDDGDMKGAYRLAAEHASESPTSQADAEFHAGWYAFRGLGDAKTGAVHFARIADIAEGPISRSRAYYWLGRTADAGGPGNAKDFYTRAAAYGTSFYGQLAAQKLGLDVINVASPTPSALDRVAFARREAVNAITRLEGAGFPSRADTLYLDLAAELTSPGELALLAAMAERRENHFLALKVGKIAAARGIDIGALTHPLGVIPDSANISGSGKALAYAIARQESEFNISAVSSAGAQGLLQLLPGTARDVAKRTGLAYSPSRLVTDAGYNATLGAAFLGEQLNRFKGSYVLTFAGYNAGPKRAQGWIDRYGDPRGKDLDTVVDWIERIPYTETRSYVQRVMENYQVYKMRLAGKFDIAGDLVDGR